MIDDRLVFTRSDQSVMEMGKATAICCGSWGDSAGVQAVKILIYDADGGPGAAAGWKLFLSLDGVSAGGVYALPTSPSNRPEQIYMFVADIPGNNELASDADGSSGAVSVHSLECGPPLRVSFSIDATLGSELGGAPAIAVVGTFDAVVVEVPDQCEYQP